MTIPMILFAWGRPVVAARVPDLTPRDPYSEFRREIDISKVQSILAEKIGGDVLSEKVQRKLLALSDTKLQLMASLADRIASGRDTSGADLALFLLTVLLVLT